jgi:transposase
LILGVASYSEKNEIKMVSLRMFVRKKMNRSGTTSVVIVDKSKGKPRYIKHLGTSSNALEIEHYIRQGQAWIRTQSGLTDMFEQNYAEKFEREAVDYFFNNIENILLNGTQLIIHQVFGLIGFHTIDDEVLKSLVLSRICQPLSKVATVEYLKSHFDEDLELHKIYRYLDVLADRQQDTIHKISVAHTRKVLGGKIGLVFYDVTTLYFETDFGDELRKTGFSKDGKHSQPQIVLGLLVSEGGYPLSYSIHEGNKYEGHTMLPVVEDFVKKFDLKDFVVVADSGLMNAENIVHLEEKKYKYILGARIKNEDKAITKWILSIEKVDGNFYEYQKAEKCRLILGYSEKRAQKDAYNREKGIKRLEKDFGRGKITKDKINRRGYNKYLKIGKDVPVEIDYSIIAEDAKWDGWKGYITNTTLAAKTVYEQYRGLWQVERAFRITKGTLELRPIFHFTPKRIKAHICICFVAYKVYKELERILKANSIGLSLDKVLDIAKTITTIRLRLPETGKTVERTMLISERHKSIARLFDADFWENNRVRME